VTATLVWYRNTFGFQ